MANSWTHAESTARRFGGKPEDYIAIHDWFDDTKAAYGHQRHRAIKHHSFGIFMCQDKFGHTIENSAGRRIPTRLIAEQHVIEDCGFIPTIQDWLGELPVQPWMVRGAKPLSRILESAEQTAALHADRLPSEGAEPGTLKEAAHAS